MSKEKFTPAPWYPVEYGGYWSIQNLDEYGPHVYDILNQEDCSCAEQNAKLAAHAPEMYELLKQVCEISGMQGQVMHQTFEVQKEAIKLLDKINDVKQ